MKNKILKPSKYENEKCYKNKCEEPVVVKLGKCFCSKHLWGYQTEKYKEMQEKRKGEKYENKGKENK